MADLDEDLFEFDEVFSLEDDPFHNGTLDPSGQPARPVPAPEADALLPEETATERVAPVAAAPEPAPAQAEPIAEPARHEPMVEAAPALETATEPQDAAPLPSLEDVAADPSRMHAPTTADRDRGPRFLLPEDVPYSLAGNNSHLIAALIACFLMVNTGIFFLAHQASSNVNESLSQATGLIADAISMRGQGEAPLQAAQPSQFGPGMTHEVELPPQRFAVADEKETWIDPRDYKNPHEFAVGNAKKMMEEGRFEEARRLLYWVLANQQRAPLTPSMRAEVDYLIPLTYYQQGRATGLEQEGA